MLSRCVVVARMRLLIERQFSLCILRSAADRKEAVKETSVATGQESENLSYFSRQLQSLRAIGGATRRLKDYNAPNSNEVERRVYEIASAVCSELGKPNFDFRICKFHDAATTSTSSSNAKGSAEDLAFLRRFKFELVRRCVDSFAHDVMNSDLHEIQHISDVISYFSNSISTANPLERMAQQRDLPPNLAVRTDYMRFDPETDTMFDGQTAFPGRDTIVSSLRYSRKYKSVRTRKRQNTYVHPLDQS